MSKRLQVTMDDQEWLDVVQVAREEGVTVSHWVRRTLREARRQRPEADVEAKLHAVRRAAAHGFPTADIEQMLEEAARGHRSAPDA